MEQITTGKNVSPIDGRYNRQTREFSEIFSEFALQRFRLVAEVQYLLALNIGLLPRKLDFQEIQSLTELCLKFDDQSFSEIAQFEKETNHDVKSVEYFLRSKMKGTSLEDLIEYVHIGRTSEDITNAAYALAFREGLEVLLNQYKDINNELEKLAWSTHKMPLLALTHGQSASPSTLGWEMKVFQERLKKKLSQFTRIEFPVKFNGATGGNNALYAAFPEMDWRLFQINFIDRLNQFNNKSNSPKYSIRFVRNVYTTQIDPHDNYGEICDLLKQTNTILIDFATDMWAYISREVFLQKPVAGEVGSSAMPHKINPIAFENAEGNLGMANAMFEFFSRKLPVHRLQRDLSDSTVERNFGVAFAHTLISLKNLKKGLGRLEPNPAGMVKELNNHWEVVAEAYQVILRKAGVPDAYEILKKKFRQAGAKITKKIMHDFINEVNEQYNIPDHVVKMMRKITPSNYIGNRSLE